MKTVDPSVSLRAFTCLLGAGCALWGGLALLQCLFPGYCADGGQLVYTQSESAIHAAAALFYTGVFFVPPGWLTQQLAYWPVFVLRIVAVVFTGGFLYGLPWSTLERFAVLLDVILAVCLLIGVLSSVFELLIRSHVPMLPGQALPLKKEADLRCSY